MLLIDVFVLLPKQTLTPHNKGLIRRAISQSGVAFCPWAINENPRRFTEEVQSNQTDTCGASDAAFSIMSRTFRLDVMRAFIFSLQVALKLNCRTDDTMVACLKMTDPVALTMAATLSIASSADSKNTVSHLQWSNKL